MPDSQLTRSVRQAIPAILASLAPFGVTAAHCLPGPDGYPVLWIAVTTDAQREAIAGRSWWGAQLHMMLLRHGVPPTAIGDIRVMYDSQESIERLLGSA